MRETTDVRVSPIPLYECDLKVGDRVRVIDAESGFSPDEELYVLGVEWRHQRGRVDFGWNITLAGADEIAKGYGATDGWNPQDLIPVCAALEPAPKPATQSCGCDGYYDDGCEKCDPAKQTGPKPAGGEWVTLPVQATEEMIEAGKSALRDHTDVYMDGSVVVGSGAVEAIYNAMQEDAPPPPSADSAQDVGELVEAARKIWPYLVWTIRTENSACHPTMPSAVAAFGNAFGFPEAAEERFARFKRSSTDGQS